MAKVSVVDGTFAIETRSDGKLWIDLNNTVWTCKPSLKDALELAKFFHDFAATKREPLENALARIKELQAQIAATSEDRIDDINRRVLAIEKQVNSMIASVETAVGRSKECPR